MYTIQKKKKQLLDGAQKSYVCTILLILQVKTEITRMEQNCNYKHLVAETKIKDVDNIEEKEKNKNKF